MDCSTAASDGLWLAEAEPADLRRSPALRARVEGVYQHRSKSNREATNKLAAAPARFGEIRQPATRYLATAYDSPWLQIDHIRAAAATPAIALGVFQVGALVMPIGAIAVSAAVRLVLAAAAAENGKVPA